MGRLGPDAYDQNSSICAGASQFLLLERTCVSENVTPKPRRVSTLREPAQPREAILGRRRFAQEICILGWQAWHHPSLVGYWEVSGRKDPRTPINGSHIGGRFQDLGFHWILVQDEFGTVPAIQYENTTIILYPLTMISKRVEKHEKIDRHFRTSKNTPSNRSVQDNIDAVMKVWRARPDLNRRSPP